MPSNSIQLAQSAAAEIDRIAAVAGQAPDSGRGNVQEFPWDVQQCFLPLPLDLSTLAADVLVPQEGYELTYLANGSTVGGCLIVNNVPLFPGMKARAYFRQLRVRRGLSADGSSLVSATSGTALLVISKVPQVSYSEIPQPVLQGQAGAAVTQNLTGSAPTLSTDGFPVTDNKGIRVTVVAASGQSLSGGGTLQAYYYQPTAGAWFRDEDLDLTIPADASGQAGWTFGDMQVAVPVGRAMWVTNGVTVSGGTTVKTYFDVG